MIATSSFVLHFLCEQMSNIRQWQHNEIRNFSIHEKLRIDNEYRCYYHQHCSFKKPRVKSEVIRGRQIVWRRLKAKKNRFNPV